ncbi:MAG: rhodanese-like domain-containing protein [Legionellales bacterium]|jgi:rhodanese-related sulfurtransferase|nr:rhodanese-like domain-containing protein [Legionellales bacterium]
MNEVLIFISDNYLFLLAMGFGYFLSQQQSPLLGLLMGVNYISSQDAVIMANKGTVMLDIRNIELYNESHITGALNINSVKNSGKKKKDYIAYNNDGSVSYQEIKLLKSFGVDGLAVLGGGIDGWKSDGLPIKNRKKND